MPKGLKKGSACKECGKLLGTRNKLGCCIGCRTDELRRAAVSHDPIRPFHAERVAYYAARAELGLPLFTGSPWARLPGAANRLGERQMKLAIATGTVALADSVKKLSEHGS